MKRIAPRVFCLMLVMLGLSQSGSPSARARLYQPPEDLVNTTRTMLPMVMVPGASRFAVIGDYGTDGDPPLQVGALVRGWSPDAVFTTGDNNYNVGAAETIDRHIGQYYQSFIAPYRGTYGAGSASNRFFPSLGNHDWGTPGAQPYLDYFTLPNNERYYDVTIGPVQWFVLDSDPHEPDGVSSTSVQGQWLQARLQASTACWKLVTMHHPPYSSGAHGPSTWMQWPFKEWGADAVLAGHDHTYERIIRDGLPYMVNGLGGAARYSFPTVIEGSVVRYNGQFGAMRITATRQRLLFEFITISGELIDQYELTGTCEPPPIRVYPQRQQISPI